MTIRRRRRAPHAITLALAILIGLVTGTLARAGTTGGISGVVTEAGTTAPIAGVRVTVASPSQTSSTTTDSRGHFAFVSLAPDEYTISLERSGYSPVSYAGIAVFADAQQTLTFAMHPALKTIANVTSRSCVEPRASGNDGRSLLDQLRAGGAHGGARRRRRAQQRVLGHRHRCRAPTSRPIKTATCRPCTFAAATPRRSASSSTAFPSTARSTTIRRARSRRSASSNCRSTPARRPPNAEAQGLAGFINQVIKTGTFPGYASVNAGFGTPIFYHNLNVEAGGATPDRLFSYYVGIGGYNQDYRYVDQFARRRLHQ